MKRPDRMNIVIFRENTEDVYAGIEWKEGTAECKKLIDFLNNECWPAAQEEDSRRLGHRHQADFDYGNQAPGAHGH